MKKTSERSKGTSSHRSVKASRYSGSRASSSASTGSPSTFPSPTSSSSSRRKTGSLTPESRISCISFPICAPLRVRLAPTSCASLRPPSSRRSHQAGDGAAQVAAQLGHGDHLQEAALGLVQPQVLGLDGGAHGGQVHA